MASSPEFALLLDLRVAIFVALSLHCHHHDGILGRFWVSWAGAKPSSGKNEATIAGILTLPRGEFFFIVAREGIALGGGHSATVSRAGLSTLITSIAASIGLRAIKRPTLTIPQAISTPIPENPIDS